MAERVFLLPDPGEGLTEAEVVAWLVAEGDEVELNQPIAEVETAKAAVEIPSPYAGRIARLHAEAGATVAVGTPLVTFEVDAAPQDGVEDVPAGGPARGLEDGAAEDAARSHAAAGAGREVSVGSQGGAEPSASPSSASAGGTVSTPAVRRLAKDLGVDLGAVTASGPGGRITADDVRRAAVGAGEDLGTERQPVGAVRRAIADNLTRQATIPQVTTFRTLDCIALQAFRAELGVSPLPVVAAALCRTVGDHPLLNASWAGDAIETRRKISLGVATDTEHGLMVPVVRDASTRGIADLSAEIRRLAEAARAGRLALTETANPTIAISNTGSYGSEAGTPILAPGTAVTFAVGVIAPRGLVVDGEVVARPACTLSLTFDHRVLDGAQAGRALTDLVALLEDDARLRDLPR